MSQILAYRPAIDSDMRLVVEGFLDSYRTSHAAGLISMERWHDVMKNEWMTILARPGTEVFVAYCPDEKGTMSDLYGYIVVERSYEHKGEPMPFVVYIYVKHSFRKKGWHIFSGLFKAAEIDPSEPFHYACKTAAVSRLKPKTPKAQWKPLAMRFPPPKKTP